MVMSAEHDPLADAFDALPLHRFLGVRLEERRPGFARVRLYNGPKFRCGVEGSVHGRGLDGFVGFAHRQGTIPLPVPGEPPGRTAGL